MPLDPGETSNFLVVPATPAPYVLIIRPSKCKGTRIVSIFMLQHRGAILHIIPLSITAATCKGNFRIVDKCRIVLSIFIRGDTFDAGPINQI